MKKQKQIQLTFTEVIEAIRGVYAEYQAQRCKEEGLSSFRLPDYEKAIDQLEAGVIAFRAAEVGQPETTLRLEWSRGYLCAVANILRSHGEEIIARDVLLGMGTPSKEEINPDDLEVLIKHGLLKRTDVHGQAPTGADGPGTVGRKRKRSGWLLPPREGSAS